MAASESGGRAVKIEGAGKGRGFAVFLRAANVGGHQVFKPSQLARTLGALGCRSIGAAGTFAFTGARSAAAVEAALRSALPIAPELRVVAARDIAALVAARPFGASAAPPGETRFLTVLIGRPTRAPKLPLSLPKAADWQVRVVARNGPFVLSRRRAKVPGKFYPNEVVERAFGAPSTTRSWSTVEALARALAPQ